MTSKFAYAKHYFYLFYYYTMHPRLYMQSFQYVIYDSNRERIIFETRHVNGARSSFFLSKEQFFALDDAIAFIDEDNSFAYNNFPLGQNTWLYYDNDGANIYKNMENYNRIYFDFVSFYTYKRYTHSRLLSLIRLNNDSLVDVELSKVGNARRKLKVKSTCNKRTFPNEVQRAHRNTASKRNCREIREASPRSTDDVNMSSHEEEGAVLSKWQRSSARWRCDSNSSSTSDSKD
jgi:hypothetical protein